MRCLDVKGLIALFGAFAGKNSELLIFRLMCRKCNLQSWISLSGEFATDVRGVSNFCCLAILKHAFQCFHDENFKPVNYETNELFRLAGIFA